MRNDSRSKSYSADDKQYETIHLGDIKRVKSTHLDRKLSNSARIPRRQTVIERQRRQPAPLDAVLNDNAAYSSATDAEAAPLEIEIVDERFGHDLLLQDDDDDTEGPNPDAPATLSDLTERIRIGASPAPSIRSRPGHGSTHGSQHLEVPNAAGYPKRQYLSELSALELFIVKHLAVLTLAPIVSEYFTLEELLDLIGQRKQTLWGRFVKGLKTDKKKPKGKCHKPVKECLHVQRRPKVDD
jgi:hypothetical protein